MQVPVEVIEGLVAASMKVHLDTFHKRLERRPGEIEPGDERLEGLPLRSRRRAAIEATGHLFAPPLHLGCAGLRRRLVHGIVHGAAKIPDRDNRAALVGGEHEERVIEAGVSCHAMPGPQSLAQNTVRQSSAGTSVFVSAGRRAKTSKSAPSSLSRILVPPSHVARSS